MAVLQNKQGCWEQRGLNGSPGAGPTGAGQLGQHPWLPGTFVVKEVLGSGSGVGEGRACEPSPGAFCPGWLHREWRERRKNVPCGHRSSRLGDGVGGDRQLGWPKAPVLTSLSNLGPPQGALCPSVDPLASDNMVSLSIHCLGNLDRPSPSSCQPTGLPRTSTEVRKQEL